MAPRPRYWFPAKRYGWGWGPPSTWQGWVVLVLFIVLLVAGGSVFSPAKVPALYVAYMAVLSAVMIGVCYLKGEPPKWRWGGR
jgi:hypothetical protein